MPFSVTQEMNELQIHAGALSPTNTEFTSLILFSTKSSVPARSGHNTNSTRAVRLIQVGAT